MALTFGERLKSLRAKYQMSQREVANQIGMTKSAYALYEQNRREPSNSTIGKICGMMHCDPNYLFGFSDAECSSDLLKDSVYVLLFNPSSLVYGKVPAAENIGTFALPKSENLREGSFYFAFAAPDNSMSDDGIRKGDCAVFSLVSSMAMADEKIYAVAYDGKAMIRKCYFTEDDHGRKRVMKMVSANSEFQEIVIRPTDRVRVFGTMEAVIRNAGRNPAE